jgi:NTP pyrophosphatase (non-canonical NTP hydrolase)
MPMTLEDYECWLVNEQWNGYPLAQMLDDALPVVEDDPKRYNYDALRSLTIITNGLTGEAGEATEHFKKWVRDGLLDRKKAALELGDALAYLTWLAATLDLNLATIARLNRDKLIRRGRKS